MDARPGRADFAGPLGSAAKDVGRSKIEVGSANERSREAPGGRGCSEVALAAPRADDDRDPGGDAPPGGGTCAIAVLANVFFWYGAGVAKTGRKSGAFFSGDVLGRREATREVRGVSARRGERAVSVEGRVELIN